MNLSILAQCVPVTLNLNSQSVLLPPFGCVHADTGSLLTCSRLVNLPQLEPSAVPGGAGRETMFVVGLVFHSEPRST